MNTKKYLKRAISILCLAAVTAGITVGASQRQEITVEVNKVTVISNNQTISDTTLLWNDQTYIPMRATLEAAGCKVDWNQNTYTATVSNRYSAIANTMYQSFQSASIMFDEYKSMDALQNVIEVYRDYGYSSEYRSEFAAPILSGTQGTATSAYAFVSFGIATQALYLGENGWSQLLPEFQGIYQDMLAICEDFSSFVSQMQRVSTLSQTELADLTTESYRLQNSMISVMIRMNYYMQNLSQQLVYSPTIH